MIQLIRNDGILRTKQGLKQPGISIKTARVENGIFTTMKLGYLSLQLFVQILRKRQTNQ